MSAVFKREFRTYFTSPIGYIVLAIFFFLSSFFFTINNLFTGSANLSYTFNNTWFLAGVMLIVLPILTMRLMSDDKRQKTDQILLTAPVSLTGIVLGKFFAAFLLFVIGLSIMLVFAFIIATQITPDWLVIFSNFIGLLLLGSVVIAMGLLISCLTESQFVSALCTILICVLLLLLDLVSSMFASNKFAAAVVQFLSITNRYSSFATGLMQYDDIIFFSSITGLFLFLAVRVLDRKRWN